MQLYHAPASPFVRKVMVTLHETGQIDDVELIPTQSAPVIKGTSPASGNPLGKIPTLIRSSGPALFDSRVICRYLNERAGASLYPDSRLFEVLTLEALADGLMDAAVLMVYESRFRPEEHRSTEWVDGQWTKVSRALDALEAQWVSHLRGPLDVSQIATACALDYLDFRHPDRAWRTGRDSLAAWHSDFGTRPSMQATAPC